jgi:acyl-CoA thioesterase
MSVPARNSYCCQQELRRLARTALHLLSTAARSREEDHDETIHCIGSDDWAECCAIRQRICERDSVQQRQGASVGHSELDAEQRFTRRNCAINYNSNTSNTTASVFNLTTTAPKNQACCVDLDHVIHFSQNYTYELWLAYGRVGALLNLKDTFITDPT